MKQTLKLKLIAVTMVTLLSGCSLTCGICNESVTPPNEEVSMEKDIKIGTEYKSEQKQFTLLFDTNSHTLNASSAQFLNSIKQALSHDSRVSIIVQGHADERGDKTFNVELSKKRSQAIINYLELPESAKTRFELSFYGEDKPACQGITESDLQCNRRVDIYIKQ